MADVRGVPWERADFQEALNELKAVEARERAIEHRHNSVANRGLQVRASRTTGPLQSYNSNNTLQCSYRARVRSRTARRVKSGRTETLPQTGAVGCPAAGPRL